MKNNISDNGLKFKNKPQNKHKKDDENLESKNDE